MKFGVGDSVKHIHRSNNEEGIILKTKLPEIGFPYPYYFVDWGHEKVWSPEDSLFYAKNSQMISTLKNEIDLKKKTIEDLLSKNRKLKEEVNDYLNDLVTLEQKYFDEVQGLNIQIECLKKENLDTLKDLKKVNDLNTQQNNRIQELGNELKDITRRHEVLYFNYYGTTGTIKEVAEKLQKFISDNRL